MQQERDGPTGVQPNAAARIRHLKGSPRDVGRSLGQAMGGRLQRNIDRYMEAGPAQHGRLDWRRLRVGALPWLRSLPQRFQDELEGLAQGANIPLQRVAEWYFVDANATGACTGLLYTIGGHTWVARNNDLWAPELWGYITVHEIDGRIPRMDFGMEGDVFTSTGVNRNGLWLHYQWLPTPDAPTPQRPHMSCFVLLSEALETCRSLQQVEDLLDEVNRDQGMMLFAIDGRTDEFALWECTCTKHRRRAVSGDCVVGTNHYCTNGGGLKVSGAQVGSRRRLQRVKALLADVGQRDDATEIPHGLIRILADDGVEARGEGYGTVSANVACPSQRQIWYTFGGFPASSSGSWQQVDWPWAETPPSASQDGLSQP